MNTAFTVIGYIIKKYEHGSLPASPNTYQTWWGLLQRLYIDYDLTGLCFALEKPNEKGEVEYHRVDPLRVVKLPNGTYQILEDHNTVSATGILDFN